MLFCGKVGTLSEDESSRSPARTYSPTPGASTSDACVRCPTGTRSFAGAMSVDACAPAGGPKMGDSSTNTTRESHKAFLDGDGAASVPVIVVFTHWMFQGTASHRNSMPVRLQRCFIDKLLWSHKSREVAASRR